MPAAPAALSMEDLWSGVQEVLSDTAQLLGAQHPRPQRERRFALSRARRAAQGWRMRSQCVATTRR